MTNLDDVRKEIAVRHDTLVGKDDPILMMVTIFDKVIEQMIGEHVASINAQHDANVKTLINAMQQNMKEMKAEARRVVTDGAGFASDQLHNAIKATMDEGREELRKDIRHAWNKVEEARKASIVWAALSGIFALISVVANYVF